MGRKRGYFQSTQSSGGERQGTIFLLQAENDYSLGPSHVLSKKAERTRKDFRSKIYPAFGKTHHDGHWGFCSAGMDVWGSDVLAFLAEQMKSAR
jgi:hypothetical protein